MLYTPSPLSFLVLKWTSKTVVRNKAAYMIRAVVKEYVMKNSICERKTVERRGQERVVVIPECAVLRLPHLPFDVIVAMRIVSHT